jgi:type IX secretion system PorP/SprF family membrane protein
MTMRNWVVVLILIASVEYAFAQDPEFSQYYAAPLLLNPAFTGTASDHRLIANYRNQWPSITNGFVTYALSYDYNLPHLNSGVGLMVMTDKAGTANLKSTTINFQYAYKVKLADKWVLSSGLNFGLGHRNIDFSKLVFGDQLAFDNDGGTPSDDPAFSNLSSTTYFDFGGGILAYNRKFWLGFSASHLNKPNRSLIDEEALIPIKTSVHGGVRIPLYHGVFKKDKVAAIMPSFVYKRQGPFDQLDLGTYFLYQPVILGVWYRGIPIKQNVMDNVSHDAAVVVLGFQLSTIEVMYSYDVTVSELGPISGGAHEIALKYKIELATSSRPRRKQKFLPCPTFLKD